MRDGARYVTKEVLVITGWSLVQESRIVRTKNSGRDSFDDLKERGLTGVQLVVSDGHRGIQKAAEVAFLGASWQMCQVHCTRAVLRNIPRKHQKEVVEGLKEA